MTNDKKTKAKLQYGFQPAKDKMKKGHQPAQSNLDPLNPPSGGSGVPASSDDSGKTDKKD